MTTDADDLYTKIDPMEFNKSMKLASKIAATWPESLQKFSSSTIPYPNTEPLDDKTLYKENAS